MIVWLLLIGELYQLLHVLAALSVILAVIWLGVSALVDIFRY